METCQRRTRGERVATASMLKEVATESGDADVTICALSDTQLYCESVLAQLHREYSGEQQRGAEPERGGCHDERGVGGHDSIVGSCRRV
ncbi:hypothetical protein C6341_g20512 [Phytophthora cactorum]|nr:hypothetical protein C6341_g20512 [Phytophthora cactorum]